MTANLVTHCDKVEFWRPTQLRDLLYHLASNFNRTVIFRRFSSSLSFSFPPKLYKKKSYTEPLAVTPQVKSAANSRRLLPTVGGVSDLWSMRWRSNTIRVQHHP